METIPFTRQRTVKLFTLGVIGLGILLGSPAATLAKDNFGIGHTYCMCNCATSGGVGRLYWEKIGACQSANGKKCTYNGKAGTLNSCDACKATSQTICDFTAAMGATGGTGARPGAQQDFGVQPTNPDPIMPEKKQFPLKHRGIEGEQPEAMRIDPPDTTVETK